MMKIEDKKARLKELEELRSSLMQEADDLWDQIKPLKTSIANHDLEEHFRNGINFQSIMSLPWSKIDYSRDWYQKIHKWFESQPGIYQTGYYPETNQCAINIHMDKQLPLENQRTIENVYPHMKPLKEGHIEIGIFEHTCSEYGSYYLKVTTPDQPLKLILCRKSYGWENELQEWDNWNDALTYIHQKHHR